MEYVNKEKGALCIISMDGMAGGTTDTKSLVLERPVSKDEQQVKDVLGGVC